MATFTFKPYLNKKAKTDGTHLLMIRVTKDRKVAFVGTGIFLKLTEYNPKSKEKPVRATSLKAAVYNDSIRKLMDELEALSHGTLKEASAQELCQRYKHKEEKMSFLDFYEHELGRMEKTKSHLTHEKYKNNLNKLKGFLGKKGLPFTGLTLTLLKDYEAHLLGFNKRNTVSKALAFLNTIVRRAVAENHIPYQDNPFLKFKLSWTKSHKEKLSPSEIESLKNVELASGTKDIDVRNIFFFQFYCAGMRVGDAIKLRWKNILKDQSGNLERLSYTMDKTDKPVSLKIKTGAIEILEHYREINKQTGKSIEPEDFIFPFLRNDRDYSSEKYLEDQKQSATAYINKRLKVIAKKAGIEKNVSSHIARHTFASQAVKKTGDVYAISKALRHSSLKITEQYLKSIDEEAADNVLDQLFD